MIGGRNVGAWVTAFAYGTMCFSAVVFVGYAGQHGWNIGIGAIWIGIGNAIFGCLLSWLLFANRTRKITKKLNAKTMPEYFEKRYSSKGMKILAAIINFLFFWFHILQQFMKVLDLCLAQCFPKYNHGFAYYNEI